MKRIDKEIIFNQRERNLSGYGSIMLSNVPVTVAELRARSQELINDSIVSSQEDELRLDREAEVRERAAEEAANERVPLDRYALFQRAVDMVVLADRLEQHRLPTQAVVDLPSAPANIEAFQRIDPGWDDLGRAS